jgi:RHS repeat-associated protein
VTSISAATNNQILDAGWSYDAAGNIIAANNAGTSVALQYDAEDRQVAYCYTYTANCVNTPGTGVTVYYYDGEGQRVEQIDPTTGTTVFVYDAFGELVADYGGSAMPSSGTEYATVDDVGTTRLVTDSQGSVLERHDFEPFGHELMGTEGGWRSSVAGYGVTPTSVRQQFTGKERDGETGLDYFGARYFSSAQGRWTSPDWSPIPRPVPYATLADPQTFNLYSYVRNNPLSRIDPDGHFDCTGKNARSIECQYIANWNKEHGIGPTAKKQDPSAPGVAVKLPNGNSVSDPYSANGVLMAPVSDLRPVADAGKALQKAMTAAGAEPWKAGILSVLSLGCLLLGSARLSLTMETSTTSVSPSSRASFSNCPSLGMSQILTWD